MRITLLCLFLALVPTAGYTQSPARGPASWSGLVEEIMSLEDRLPALTDVMATRNALVMRFNGSDADSVRHAVSVVARILNASRDDVYVTVMSADGARTALAVTAGGFPPERISIGSAQPVVTLQAIRLEPTASTRSERSSPR